MDVSGRGTDALHDIDGGGLSMRAAIFNGPRDIIVGERPDPRIENSTDAIVRVTLACVCGSDLWYWRGASPHDRSGIGHEAIGIVEAVGSAVDAVREGDLVVVPFAYSDGTCPNCRNGVQTACLDGGFFGSDDGLGGQAELLRVPQANGTLVALPAGTYDDATLRSLLTLSDVMGTGHHALMLSGATPGDTSPSSGTVPSACPRCSPPNASARRGSSRSPGTRHARRSPASSARRTSWNSAAMLRSNVSSN
jgi:threonine dehydrogenase-like Zn-dependent dehydrogenase